MENGHIPCEILRYVYFFIKQEGRRVYGKLKENPLQFHQEDLRFHCYSNLNPKINVSVMQWRNLRKISILSISHGDLVVNYEDEEEIDLDTLENSNENDENEINEKDKETVTLDDPITNETKAVPAVIID